MPLKIALIGASGRLGRAIATLITQDPTLELLAAITHSHSPHLNTPYFHLLLTDNRHHPNADLFIDVSLAPALSQNLDTALAHKKPLIVGTTGLSPHDLILLDQAAQQIPLFYTPNFSLGLALMRKMSLLAAQLPNAHIDLIETHHAQKKDAPSGTALSLAKTLSRSIPIHSLRTGATIGEHTLLFNTPEERITLTHASHTREAYARGALAAARFLSQQKPGLYNMDHLLDIC